MHEIEKKLPPPINRIHLNQLTPSDKNKYIDLLNFAGLLNIKLERDVRSSADIREVVTSIYNNSQLLGSYKSEFNLLLSDNSAKQFFIAANIINWTGEELNPSLLKRIVKSDGYSEMNKYKGAASEIFRFIDGEIRATSSILSEYFLSTIIEPIDTAEMITIIIKELAPTNQDRSSRSISSRLMQVATIKKLLQRSKHADIMVSNIFNDLYRDIYINKEPLFWLQYLIHMLNTHDLQSAEDFIKTAYSRASEIKNFKTYQLDTHALRLYIKIEQNSTKETVEKFELIFDNLAKISTMLNESSHRIFIFNVLEYIPDFISLRINALTIKQKNDLKSIFEVINIALAKLKLDPVWEKISKKTSAMIDDSISKLLTATIHKKNSL